MYDENEWNIYFAYILDSKVKKHISINKKPWNYHGFLFLYDINCLPMNYCNFALLY